MSLGMFITEVVYVSLVLVSILVGVKVTVLGPNDVDALNKEGDGIIGVLVDQEG